MGCGRLAPGRPRCSFVVVALANVCKVCHHAKRKDIERDLARKVPRREIARRYGPSTGSLDRHTKNCMQSKLVQAIERVDSSSAEGLLRQMRSIQDRTLAILESAEKMRDLRTALAAIREVRSNLELLARLIGLLRPEGPTVNILVNPQWVEIRSAIVGVLEGHPEARAAVVEALRRLGGGA